MRLPEQIARDLAKAERDRADADRRIDRLRDEALALRTAAARLAA